MTPPRITPSVRRDRHGRGLRGIIIPPSVPAWRRRSERFDDIISMEINTYRHTLGEEVDRVEYGVLDVPQTDPTPWEDGIPQARFFPMDGDKEGRIIFYRFPILQAARGRDLSLVIHAIVTQQLAAFLGTFPEDIDFLGG
ncbi:MAG: metallopeptidase family protein [Flaviflexus sp.]|nr:metallopeptidase family protein [Flaviflexus sp.]